MIKVTVVQPKYYCGDNPDKKIAEFIIEQMNSASKNSILVLPEYCNAGGLTNKDEELKALGRAQEMKNIASEIAKERNCYLAINVLESREDRIFNSTYLYGKDGKKKFVYDKIHLPPAEINLGVQYGNGDCTCEVDGIKFAFMTCYDVYYNEQIEYIAKFKPDIIIVPGYQRGERVDIIRAQAKLVAFRCNAYLLRASYSMDSNEKGGCSMIVAPNGEILKDLGSNVGSASVEIEEKYKYTRTAGFGMGVVNNDQFIDMGMRPEIFDKR